MILETSTTWPLLLSHQFMHLLIRHCHSNLQPSIRHALLLLFPKLNLQCLQGLHQDLPQTFYQVFFIKSFP